jgi:RHS repeat-associated protein
MSYPNGVTTDYTYDAESRLTGIEASLGAAPITQFGYQYDAVGNRTQKSTLSYTEDYGYDPAYQLTQVQRTGATPNRWFYTYDRAGNRTAEQVDTSVTSSSYDEMNRLLGRQAGGNILVRGSVSEPSTVTVQGEPVVVEADNTFAGPAVVPSGTGQFGVTATDPAGNSRTNTYEISTTGSAATYQYDPNGNLTQKVENGETWDYVWNAENQLIRVCKDLVPPQTCDSDGVAVASFQYDALGRRLKRVAAGLTTTWAYDGVDILREIAGTATVTYVSGAGIDQPLRKETATGATYYHADGLGSIVATTDASGAVSMSRQYGVWGHIQAGGTQPGYGFTGREWDSEIGLHYYRARYYDPDSGRFITEDPITYRGGVNFYAYVGNNPTTWIDPEGLQAREASAGLAVGVCGAASAGTCAAAAAAAAAATAAITCANSPQCRRNVRCLLQLSADLARCTGKGICPGAEQGDTEACFKRAWDNYRACVRGWPRPFEDPYPPPGNRPLPPPIKKPPSQGPGPVPVE